MINNRPYDILNATPAFLKDNQGQWKFHGIHGAVTGRIQEMPKFELISYYDQELQRTQYVNRVQFKIRSHKVSKKLAYLTGKAETDTWTDQHNNTYFQVDVYDANTIQFLQNNHKNIVRNQQVTIIGFFKMKPKQSTKDGLWYPNFYINAKDVIFNS